MHQQLKMSLKNNTPQIEECENYFDFSAFLNEFIKDDAGNALSLVHFCELFGIQEAGVAHDPQVDAINLANLYNGFVCNPDLVASEYLKHLRLHSGSLPGPINKAVIKLASGEDVSAKELEEEVKKYIA